ncbi:MAG: CRTAC1 family protein [Acidobacteriota bacterium]
MIAQIESASHRTTGLLLAALMVALPGAAFGDGPEGGVDEGASAAEAKGDPSEKGPEQESWFTDVAKPAGVFKSHRNRSFENRYAHIMEGYTALGASVAVADYNGDGWDDLFVTDSSNGGKNLLYRNNGDFTFTDVAAEAGVADGNDATNASANSLWFDGDNDGDPDLLVIRFGQNLLYENLGDGTFRDVTAGSGIDDLYLNCIVAVAFDYDLDGDLDLFYGNYFAPVNLFDPETPRFFPESFETAANGGGVTVFRNDGPAKGGGWLSFTDVTDEVGLGKISGWSLDLGHADADHDGDDDLYVAADFGTDNLFRNNADGTFTDVTEKSIGIDTKKGMNVDWGDFDRDGYFDIYVTNITDEYMREGNFLWVNNGDLTFTDLSRETGTHNTGWGWAGKFFDYDNDGWLDLYVVNGWVSGNEDNYVLDIFDLIIQPDVDLADARNWPPMGPKTLSGYQHNSLFRNLGGTLFQDEAPRHGLDSLLDGRGVGLGDFDHDGSIDFFVSNANREPILARNHQPTDHHWIALRLEGEASNRDAVGARVKATVDGQERWTFVNGGNGFASQSTRTLHFGLGKVGEVEKLEVFWPSGATQSFTKLAADHIYRLKEGGKLEPWTPGTPSIAPKAQAAVPKAAPKAPKPASASGADESP